MLIPFLEGRRSPNGLEKQQRAEVASEEVFSRASSAIGEVVGLSQHMDFLLKRRSPEIMAKLAQSLPDLDDRSMKNYAMLISLAEKVH